MGHSIAVPKKNGEPLESGHFLLMLVCQSWILESSNIPFEQKWQNFCYRFDIFWNELYRRLL